MCVFFVCFLGDVFCPIPEVPKKFVLLPQTITLFLCVIVFQKRNRNKKSPWYIDAVRQEEMMETSSVLDGAAPEAVPPNVDGNNYAGSETEIMGNAGEEGEGETVVGGSDMECFRHRVDDFTYKVDKLEHRVNEVAEYFLSKKQQPNSTKGGSSIMKDKEKEKLIENNYKKQMDAAANGQAVCTKRMQELMRQFGTIFRHIKNHKWAWPFQHPVDVEGLGLHDYYQVIKKPMDFDTIQRKMEAKDGNGYKNVRDMYADVKLVFTNAMAYNVEGSDVHVMAHTVTEKFEERWLLLLPKVIEEETRQKEEEAHVQVGMQISQEAAMVKMARDTSRELNELDAHLDELREAVIQKCRKMTVEEKRKLGVGLSRLSPEDLNKALDIIAQNNPGFQATAEEVDLDMDAQTESTLWRLKLFVKGALEVQAKSSMNKSQDNSKRKREICNALAKTAKKRGKKLPLVL